MGFTNVSLQAVMTVLTSIPDIFTKEKMIVVCIFPRMQLNLVINISEMCENNSGGSSVLRLMSCALQQLFSTCCAISRAAHKRAAMHCLVGGSQCDGHRLVSVSGVTL